jgi:acetyl esterase/lipase
MQRQPLDPELAPVIEAFPVLDLSPETLPMMRGVLGSGAELSDRVERTEHRAGDVPVRVHRPVGVEGPLPCIVGIHGGGYVLGSYDMDDPTFDAWCQALGVVGVSVEYRLAPEHPYPIPVEDCYTALKWAHDEAETLGIDRSRIGIRGISGGGGLAAGLALLARDRGEVPIAFQLLDCPMIDDRLQTPSMQHDDLPVWSRKANEFGWRSYLGDLYGSDDVPYTAAPARASVEELQGLPPAFVSVGSVDGFHDEDVLYALRLNQAGVPTELHVYPGASHAYQAAAGSRIAKQSARDQLEWLAHQVAR